MDVRNCKECGRLFNYLNGKPICPACKQKLEEKFAQVKEYLRANVGATINEVAEANDVEIKQIKQWVREERLSFSNDSPISIECEKCGAPIKTGRFCVQCMSKMTNTLNSAIRRPVEETKKPERDKDRMRFLDKF